jgi:amino acid transporter
MVSFPHRLPAKLLPDHPKHLLVPGGEPQPGADPSSRWWSEKDRCGDRTHVLILLDRSDETSVRHRRLSWSLRYLLPLTDASAIARNPFAINDLSGLTAGILVAVFSYWGWDSTVTVNEETEDSSRTPGVAAILSTIILVGIYVVVSIAAQAFAGPEFLIENSDDVLATLGTDVLGSPLDKLLVIAVLTSAAASTQTTILPTARTSLSMAFKGAAPKRFGNIHPAT